ncbi:Serine/threonine protein kinase related protein [hydrothermal vent metagenome]|uniref:Serine/threonine protein kinase related protein n=1 Tax=hydrothermal vent metagenome TaxID=652676 RepID=A0A1W1BEL3_9ZZZZ
MAKITRRGFIKSGIALSLFPLYADAQESSTDNRLSFIHITDSHMDLDDEDSVKSIERMVAYINANYKKLDFVLFGGDNFNNNVAGDKDAVEFKKIIEKLNFPTYLVRGNKESSASVWSDDTSIDLPEFKKLFIDGKSLDTDAKNWSLNIKGYTILGLDSTIENANNGIYDEATLKFAESRLKDGKPTVILNHHPYTNYWKGTEEKDIHKYVLNNTKEAQERLFKYPNLILTLSGHKHIDSVTQIGNTKVIVTRGFVRPLDKGMYPMRYIELDGKDISEKLIYTS